MTAVMLKTATKDIHYSITLQYQWQVLVNMVLNPLNFMNIGLIIKVHSGSRCQSVGQLIDIFCSEDLYSLG